MLKVIFRGIGFLVEVVRNAELCKGEGRIGKLRELKPAK